MRPISVLFAFALALLAVPAASAEDPTISLPNAAPLAASAGATADVVRADAISTHHGNMFNAMMTVNEAQLLQVSDSRIGDIFTDSANFTARSVGRAGDLGGEAVDFGTHVAVTKAEEADAIAKAGQRAANTAVRAASTILFAVEEVTCHQPLEVPPECDDDSLVARALGSGSDVGEAALRLGELDPEPTQDAVADLVAGLVAP